MDGEAPIYGMDIETFEAIMNEDQYDEMMERYGVKQNFYEKFPIKEATKDSTDKQCSVCIKYYKVGDKVFFLPCQHHFHIECIMPWFKTNHICPNCRYDLNEGKAENE